MSSTSFDSSPAGGQPSGASSGETTSGKTPRPRQGDVSLLDLLLILARGRSLILWTIVVFTGVGLAYSLVAPEQYTSSAEVVREAGKDGASLPSGLGGLPTGALSGLGIDLGGASSGLTPQAFPQVLRGREVQMAVARDTFSFPATDRPMTFLEYVNRPPSPFDLFLRYTLWLPFTAKNALSNAIFESPAPAGTTRTEVPAVPTKEEERALETIDDMVSSSVDQESGLMTISVTAGGPRLAASLAQSFVDHLRTRVRELRTEKVRERLKFVKQRFQEAKKELEAAEDRLAQFLDRNQNPTTASLQFQRDRLQRQVRFKEQLYSELQSKLTQARLDLQRQQPVVTVVEEPVPPAEKSAPYRTLIVLMSMILGGIVGVGVAFGRALFVGRLDDPEDQEKIEEIREAFVPQRLAETIRGWTGGRQAEKQTAGQND